MFHVFIPDLLTEGFNYHEKTPVISQMMINPVSGPSLTDTMLTLLTSQRTDKFDTTGSTLTSNQRCSPTPVSPSVKIFTRFANKPQKFFTFKYLALMSIS